MAHWLIDYAAFCQAVFPLHPLAAFLGFPLVSICLFGAVVNYWIVASDMRAIRKARGKWSYEATYRLPAPLPRTGGR